MASKGSKSGPEKPSADGPEAGAAGAKGQLAEGQGAPTETTGKLATDTAAGLTKGPDGKQTDVVTEDKKADSDKPFFENVFEGALDAAENGTLPDNKWSRTLTAYDKEAKRLGLEGSPLTNGIRTIFALMAMYSHVGDLVGGNYVERLDNDDNLKNQKLSDDDLAKILAAKKPDKLPAPANAETLKKKGLGAASTIHACQTLWGISGISDPDVLSAKLHHAEKKVGDENVPYYRSPTFNELTAQGMPYGTVLVFKPDFLKADTIVAYATGNGTECQYFDAESGSVKTFSLATADGQADDKSPISSFNLLTAFVPKFNSDPDWFKDNTDKLEPKVNPGTTDQPVQAQSPGTQAPAEAPKPA